MERKVGSGRVSQGMPKCTERPGVTGGECQWQRLGPCTTHLHPRAELLKGGFGRPAGLPTQPQLHCRAHSAVRCAAAAAGPPAALRAPPAQLPVSQHCVC